MNRIVAYESGLWTLKVYKNGVYGQGSVFNTTDMCCVYFFVRLHTYSRIASNLHDLLLFYRYYYIKYSRECVMGCIHAR